jgi:competence protein ComEC
MLTRFRAFQLDSAGSLFSFYKPGEYSLIEARLPKAGIEVLQRDLHECNVDNVNYSHITSYDNDHCSSTDLIAILNYLRPDIIEIPDYKPDTQDGALCWRILHGYEKIHQEYVQNLREINMDYIRSLPQATAWTRNNVIYPSIFNSDNKNDRSLIKLFRSDGFSVLSLGDCESPKIGEVLMASNITAEVDVLILPHHGADNGLVTKEFLEFLQPKVAIATADYDNQYGHPHSNVYQLLHDRDIPLLTTKRGDVYIMQQDGAPNAVVQSMNGDNTEVERAFPFIPKKFEQK